MEPTVFISYSHKDKEWVRNYLLKNLEENSIPCHIDYRDFDRSIPCSVSMERAIESCTKTILVFSKNWSSSENTQFEAAMLQVIDPIGAKRKIVTVLLEEVEIPLRFKIYIYYDFSKDKKSEEELTRLINYLNKEFTLEEPRKKTYPPLEACHINITRLPKTGFELYGRHKELTLLNETWEASTTNIISFIAYGGVGKSTLVDKWAEKMRWDNYRGAEKVYTWSFYSQGTRERVTSAEIFISEALKWFGDKNPTKGSLQDKGSRLANLIRKEKTLLILDGLEPLQSNHEYEKGKIKDPALSMLVTQLAKNNNGLCLITSREKVRELRNFTKGVKQIDLNQISKEASRSLLRIGSVRGTDTELETASERFGNNALAINLLATFLYGIESHHITNAKNIPILDIPEEEGKYPRSVIAAFEKRFGEGPKIQLLSILGLFDRPIEFEIIKFVCASPLIDGLTDQLQGFNDGQWNDLLEELRDCKLLAQKSKHNPKVLDCHPLVREHFAEKLQVNMQIAKMEAYWRIVRFYEKWLEREKPKCIIAAIQIPFYMKELDVEKFVDIFVFQCSIILKKEGMFSIGLKLSEKVVEIGEKEGCKNMKDAYMCHAEFLTKMGEHEKALKILEKTNLLEYPQHDYLSAKCLVIAGDCWHLQDIYDKAIATQKKAIEIIRLLIKSIKTLPEKEQDDVYELYIVATERLVQATELTGELQEAFQILTKTEQEFNNLGQANKLLAMFWYRWGKVAQLSWDLEKAKIHYEKCINIAEEQQKPEATAYGLRGLGEVMILKKEFNAAEKELCKSKEIFENCQHRGRLWIDRSLAQIKRQRAIIIGMQSIEGINLLEESEKDFLQYIDECNKMPNPNGEAWGWVCLGFLYMGAIYEGVWKIGSRKYTFLECFDKAGEIFSRTKSLLGKLEVTIGKNLAYYAGLNHLAEYEEIVAVNKKLIYQANLFSEINAQNIGGKLTKALREEILKPRNPA